MQKLDKKDIGFLKDLSKEMKNQNTLATAHPRLWVIRDIKKVATSDDYADGYDAYDEDNCEILFSEDLDERILDEIEEDDEELNDFLDRHKSLNIDIDGLGNWNIGLKVDLLSLYGNNIRLAPFMNMFYITENAGAFLTDKAAKDHIKANRHHYSDNVHTYCLHSWRNPQMERLIEVIENTDWETYKEK